MIFEFGALKFGRKQGEPIPGRENSLREGSEARPGIRVPRMLGVGCDWTTVWGIKRRIR